MTSNKYIVYEFTNGSQYRIPLAEVAQHYANKMTGLDSSGLQDNFDKIMDNPNLAITWFRVEMSWSDVHFEMIQKPREFDPSKAKQIDIQSLQVLDIP